MSLSKWPPGGHIGFFGFRTLTLLWLWISTSNFSGTIVMYMGRSLLIFSNVIIKMAWLAAILDFSVSGLCRWQGFRDVSQVCFGISISNFICMLMVVIGKKLKKLAYCFSARSLSKWPPGGHIGFFGFQTLTLVWLWISTPKLSGTILMYMCRSLLIFSNVNFKMAARQPYWKFWFRDSNFSLALNINCKLKWHNTYIYG